MIIKLTYFKISGKYYSRGEYISANSDFYAILDEVRNLIRNGTLPGLAPGVNEFIVLVIIDDLPHLLIPLQF